MAKKKSKAQRKEEHRRAMTRKRQETGWQPPPAPDLEHERLMADVAPLLLGAEDNVATTEAAMVPFMEMVLNSDALIEEPEFDGVYANPLLCVEAFGAAIEEHGFEDVDPANLSADEREDAFLELVEDMTIQVLAPELQEAVLSALRDLRQRARDEGQEALVTQSAAVYAFLDGMGSEEVWVNAGLVQALTHRSLMAGLEMRDAAEEAVARAGGRGIRGLMRRIAGAGPHQPMDDVLAKYPGLAGFLGGEVEATWDQGLEALASGALHLGLFSEAEVSTVLEKARALGIELTEEGEVLVADDESAEDKVPAFAQWTIRYVGELTTPQRLKSMQARLDDFAAEATHSQLAFLALLNEDFQAADASERLRPLLVRALLGEVQRAVGAKDEVEG